MALSTAAGEPLVLLHGLGGSRQLWDPVLPLLEAEREVVALDMPGFGAAAPLPAGVEASAVNLAAAIHRRCLELGFERPHVAGNSLGGWVALEMGRAGWAASVTAISVAGLWRRPLGERPGEVRKWAKRLRPAVMLAIRTRPGRERALLSFTPFPERIPPAEGREIVRRWIDAPGYEAANRAMRADVFDPAGYPDIPVTLAWGELDTMVKPPRPERRPAGARYVALPGVGHTPMWDDPELIAHTLLEGSRTKEMQR